MKKSTSTNKAVALKYKVYEQNAPKIVAKGRGGLAEKIIEKAKIYDVPLFQNETLADMLLDVDVGEEIPPKMYKAVVDVFIWLYKLEEKAQLSR